MIIGKQMYNNAGVDFQWLDYPFAQKVTMIID